VIRRAAEADMATLMELWREFTDELDETVGVTSGASAPEQAEREIRKAVESDVALLAEADGRSVGFALARRKTQRVGYLSDLYVRPEARRRGVARALVARVAEELGLELVSLVVESQNAGARAFYRGLGFREESLNLIVESSALTAEPRGEESFGAVYVQTDDAASIERAVSRFVPFLGRPADVSRRESGWVAVRDDVSDRDPELLRRLARELALVTGAVVLQLGVEAGAVVRYALYESGRVVDEYLSVPEFYGPLPPGDVVALGANSRVVARLTGADPARIKTIARTVASPAELPPARELHDAIAAAVGLA